MDRRSSGNPAPCYIGKSRVGTGEYGGTLYGEIVIVAGAESEISIGHQRYRSTAHVASRIRKSNPTHGIYDGFDNNLERE